MASNNEISSSRPQSDGLESLLRDAHLTEETETEIYRLLYGRKFPYGPVTINFPPCHVATDFRHLPLSKDITELASKNSFVVEVWASNCSTSITSTTIIQGYSAAGAASAEHLRAPRIVFLTSRRYFRPIVLIAFLRSGLPLSKTRSSRLQMHQ